MSAPTSGAGKGGNVTVNASESVTVSGIVPEIFQPASIGSATLKTGNVSNITINTSRVVLRDGGIITSSTLAQGSAGNLTINASDSVEISGVDPTTQIAQGCRADRGHTFTIAGRGGLPEEPTATLRGQTVWQDLQNYAPDSPQPHNEPSKAPPVTTLPTNPSLLEAVGWQTNAKGEVELVANLPPGAEVSTRDRPVPNCSRSVYRPQP